MFRLPISDWMMPAADVNTATAGTGKNDSVSNSAALNCANRRNIQTANVRRIQNRPIRSITASARITISITVKNV